MSQQQQAKTFRQCLTQEINTFLTKLTKLSEEYLVDLEMDRVQMFDSIYSFLLPVSEESPVNNNSLSHFLQSTVNNQYEKKLKRKYCTKQLTRVSGASKLFGNLSASYANESSLKRSALSFQSMLSSSEIGLSAKGDGLGSGLFFPVGGLKKEEEQCEGVDGDRSDSGSLYASRNSDSDRRAYTLYPHDTKVEIIQYASKFGFKRASERYKIPANKINLWSRALSKVKQTRGRKPIDPMMEERVCEWLKRQLERGAVLTQKIIREKAKRISCSDEFKASKGWLEKFFKRRPQLFEAYSANRKNNMDKEELAQFESNEQEIKLEPVFSIDKEDLMDNLKPVPFTPNPKTLEFIHLLKEEPSSN